MSIGAADFQAILPALVLIAGAFLLLGVDLFLRGGKGATLLEILAYGTLIGALSGIWFQFDRNGAQEPVTAFGGAVVLDGFSLFLSTVILAGTALGLFLARTLAARTPVRMAEVLALMLISGGAMILLVMARELITLFLALETMSLSVYVLAGVTRERPESGEASMKYFVVGSVASAFFLFGAALLYGATGSVFLDEIQTGLEGEAMRPLVLLGLGLALVGFAFKVGAAPFHTWLPDAYEGAPTAVTAFMSVTVKAAGFGVLLRVLLDGLIAVEPWWRQIVGGLAVITMVVGNLAAIVQSSVKRMLAYSSIAHTGYLLIGVAAAAAGGIRHPEAVSAVAFYLFAYTFMTLGAFALLMFAGRGGRDAESFEDIQGMAHRRPWAALFMAIFMLSLGGLPPTAGFFAKFTLFKATLEVASRENKLAWLVIAGIVTSVVSLAYYLRVVAAMYLQPARGDAGREPADQNIAAAIVICVLFTLFLGIHPGGYLQLARSLMYAP